MVIFGDYDHPQLLSTCDRIRESMTGHEVVALTTDLIHWSARAKKLKKAGPYRRAISMCFSLTFLSICKIAVSTRAPIKQWAGED